MAKFEPVMSVIEKSVLRAGETCQVITSTASPSRTGRRRAPPTARAIGHAQAAQRRCAEGERERDAPVAGRVEVPLDVALLADLHGGKNSVSECVLWLLELL